MKSLCIGVGTSSVAGPCPGADLDARNIYNIVKDLSTESTLLLNETATRTAVLDKMSNIVDGTDLTFMFFAGHGGSQRMKLHAPEEIDGNDEMIFTYDGKIIDDEIWNIISKSNHRVFLMFDCCHSETMFRVAPPRSMFALPQHDQIDMLCWSGCADNKVSYGDSSGGEFTKAFLHYYSPAFKYSDIWTLLENDSVLKHSEIIKSTELKTSSSSAFDGKLIFT